MSSTAVDVAIVGGGLVGASLALALRGSGLSLALIEAATPPATTPAWDERCIALNDGSRRIFESLGLWNALAEQTAAIRSTHISERGRFGVARFKAEDAGLDALGFNTPMRALGALLLAEAANQSSLAWHCPDRVEALSLGPAQVDLTLASGQRLAARLVVAADGAGSAVRRLLGLDAEVRDYQQSALVTALCVQRDPQGVAYERFTPEGPFAVLPKPRLPGDAVAGHPCSLIWTLPTARAEALQALPEDEFLVLAQDTFGERLGRFLRLGRRVAHPLSRTLNETLTASRIVFCGNAAQSLHPVAAQGFNLGLRDVAALAVRLRDVGDPGEATVLADYAAARQPDRQRTADFTDRLVRVFSNRLPLLSSLRSLGLLALDLMPPAREGVMRQNLGHLGLPRALPHP